MGYTKSLFSEKKKSSLWEIMESFGAIIDDKAINLMNFCFKVFHKIQNEHPNAWTNLTNPTMHLFRIP